MAKKSDLRLVVSKSFIELGQEVEKHLKVDHNYKGNLIVPMTEINFGTGESKAVLEASIRDKDVFLMMDPMNHGIPYKMYGRENRMTPINYIYNALSVATAMHGLASRMTAVLPFFPESRQHRREGRESLDASLVLKLLYSVGYSGVLTLDVHDPGIQMTDPCMAFENLYASPEMIRLFLDNEDVDYNKTIVISPDEGASKRARFCAQIFQCQMGSFTKRRDVMRIVDGKNPIKGHDFCAPEGLKDLTGYTAIVVDDMIASGDSALDTARRLKDLGAEHVYFIATFCLFTGGINLFDEARAEGVFDAIYTTNANYIPEEWKRPFVKRADVSELFANVICSINTGEQISDLLNGTEQRKALALEVLDRKRKK